MGQYDKYPIRNAYGHIEYLTRQEIENLHERGESIEELDGGTSNRYPPHAKNPLNQARVNELFYEEQRRKEEERKKRRGRGGKVARGIASVGFAAATLGGATAHPQQQSDTTQQHYGQARLTDEGSRRGRQARDA